MSFSKYPICLIEDDPVFSESFKRQSEKLVLKEVKTLSSLEDLKKLSDLTKFSCFVVDYDLDTDTGIEVAKYLKVLAPQVPVMIISATNRPWDESHDDLTNVKAYVSKWSGLNTIVTMANIVTTGKSYPMIVRDIRTHLGDLDERNTHGIYLPRFEITVERYRA